MTKPVVLTHDDRIELRNMINNAHIKKNLSTVNMTERLYVICGSNNRNFYIYTNNNGHRVISRGLDAIADTDTMGNNLIARMDVDIVVSDVIDAYIQQLNQRVYGK